MYQLVIPNLQPTTNVNFYTRKNVMYIQNIKIFLGRTVELYILSKYSWYTHYTKMGKIS